MEQMPIDRFAKVKALKRFQDIFYRLTKVKIDFIDAEKKPLVNFDKYTPFQKTLIALLEKDIYIKLIENAFCKMVKEKKPNIIKIHGDVVNIMLPIIVNEKTIAVALTSDLRIAEKFRCNLYNFIKTSSDFEKLERLYQAIPLCTEKEIEAYADLLFLLMKHFFKNEFDYLIACNPVKEYRRAGELAKRSLDYVRKNYYQKDLSIAKISSELCISYYYFSHIFKRETNMTFINYLTKVRMEAAAKLLENLSLNIKQIAFAIGYRDSNYFSKVFKKYIHMSPCEFRNRILHKG